MLRFSFENGENCRGEAYVDELQQFEIDRLTLSETYPEIGYWARNEQSQLQVVGTRRSVGRLAILTADGIIERPLSESPVVLPGEWYRWEVGGEEQEVFAIFTPPFDPEQYTVKPADQIKKEELAS